jgi:two-component sensor histidine kinase/CheY-like chemotaxis protein
LDDRAADHAGTAKGGRRSMTSQTPPTNVLVVEDEMVLRLRAVDIVEDAGFAAVEAASADQALHILESRSDIALMLSDIQMPGSMDGLRLAHAVHNRWPAIKIILVSGQIKPSDAETPDDSRFFGKPLQVKQMIAELQGMIGEGTLAVVTKDSLSPANEGLTKARPDVSVDRSAEEESLTAENDSLRLLLEQAGIDAEVLLAQAGIDAREREAADKLQKLILGEMHHRIKNTLATVSAIASQSLRTAKTIEHGQQSIEGRLIALGRAHDLLMQASWANASLTTIVRGAIEPYDGSSKPRFSIDGPDIGIASGAVIALAMTLNELCTNTTKFGALSVPAGIVDIKWTINASAQRLNLSWTEKSGPRVEAPNRVSFGTRMMRSLGQQLNGDVQLSYHPAGFIYGLDVPLAALSTKA